MAIGRNVAIAVGALALAAGPVQAQGTADTELTAEMWAMAGVCSQYASYSVRNQALANWLNNTLAAGDAEAVMDRKNAKVAQISAQAARVQDVRGAREQAERSDELTAALMTRCRRLTNDPLAGQFFFTAMN